MLSQGSLDPEFGFGFGVPEVGVWMDWASVSGSLHQLCFCIQYLTMGSGHVAGHDSEASDWTRGMTVTWRASVMVCPPVLHVPLKSHLHLQWLDPSLTLLD